MKNREIKNNEKIIETFAQGLDAMTREEQIAYLQKMGLKFTVREQKKTNSLVDLQHKITDAQTNQIIQQHKIYRPIFAWEYQLTIENKPKRQRRSGQFSSYAMRSVTDGKGFSWVREASSGEMVVKGIAAANRQTPVK